MKLLFQAFLCALAGTTATAIDVGDSLPDVDIHYGFPPENVNLAARAKDKNIILVGLPGAFTPTWSTRQVPGYLENQDAIQALGVDEVIIYCVNDGAVMTAWAENQGVPEDGLIKLMGDPYSTLTEKLDMEMTHAGPKGVGLINRTKRFAIYAEDGVVKILRVAESEDDPAGDDFPEITLAEAMIENIKAFKSGKDEL